MINLDELEAKARAATQGNWHLNKELSRPATKLIYDDSGYLIANVGGYKFGDTENDKNASFIAAANPDTMLKLIAAMRVYREALRSYAGKGKYSEWEGPKYLTFDKFGALCAETMGPWEAEQSLAEADKILLGGV